MCSGIEAASTAWHPLGWATVYVAEIEPFPCAVLAQRLGAGRPQYMPDPKEAGIDADTARDRRAAIKALNATEWGTALPNYGDFTRIIERAGEDAGLAVDVLVGGTPCQAFSVAGNRESLADARGNLTLEFVRLVHAHSRRPNEPLRYAVWENVPGCLSTDDNAFGCFLAGLVGGDDPLHVPGGGRWPDSGMVAGPLGRAAWRILDAQHFGLAQRRRRVFLVFCPRDSGGDPAAILFERQGMSWDSAPGGEAGEGVAGTIAGGARRSGGYSSDDIPLAASLAPPLTQRPYGDNAAREGKLVAAYGGNNTAGPIDVATACNAHGGPHGRLDFESETFIAHTLRADGFDASEDGTGRGESLVPCVAPIAFSGKDYGADATTDLFPTMRAGGHTGSHPNGGVGPAIAQPSSVRRLTPRECERLQGFPDDFTRIRIRHFKARTITKNRPADMWEPAEGGGWWLMAADGPRYKALGNSMATVCMSWIGQRIAAFEAGTLDGWHFDWSLVPWVLRPRAAQQGGLGGAA